MTSVTAPMHAGGWNVIFTIANKQYLGGIYQNPRTPIVTFGNVCAELALCFEYLGNGNSLNDDLNSSNTANATNNINTVDNVDSANNVNSAGNQDGDEININPWTDIAFALIKTPDEAADSDPVNYPSFITRDTFDELVPGLASESATRQRTVHIVHHKPCNFSGSSKDHIRVQPNASTTCLNPAVAIIPGVQACHIVKQQHYHLYPLGHQSTAAQDGTRRLCQAWEKTWSPGNGILLMKHLHEFFDARLFSIHLITLRIRVFVPFEDLEPYHGRKAEIAPRVDRRALAYH